MKTVHVTQAVGSVLGQDLTRVVPGEFKGVAFAKGHIIQPEDIALLLSMGKDHIYIYEPVPGSVHENEAAGEMARLTAGDNIVPDHPQEGKINLRAAAAGVLKVDIDKLTQLNSLVGVALATLHTHTVVQKDEMVASVKIIPLLLPQSTLQRIRAVCSGEKVIHVQPLLAKQAGLVITGNEIFYGRIQDRFEAVIREKLTKLGSRLTKTVVVPDDTDQIAAAVRQLAGHHDLVFVTGGMAVDPDDVTPAAVKKIGAAPIIYGTPVLPGALFLIGYLGPKPILGIPACGMFSKITVLDVVLPQILTDEVITRQYIASLGHGGLCHNCRDECRYPNCSFCKS